jgi:Spy/CpxP family protein refolding chaperone
MEKAHMKTWLVTVGLLAAAPVFAQHNAESHPQADSHHSAYAGMQTRAVKALSEQQAADLRDGKGMTLALPAELNGYPGPSHTLELAVPLNLSEEQKRKTKELLDQMQTEAKALGAQLLANEYELDRLFKDRQADMASVEAATAKAAYVQGKLRAAHLRYHLHMAAILTPTQVAGYKELRGYR